MSEVTCSRCKGKGVIKCPTCGGSAFAKSIKDTTNKTFGLIPDEVCPNCHDDFFIDCSKCGGNGTVEVTSNVRVKNNESTYSSSYSYSESNSTSQSANNENLPITLSILICNCIAIIIAYFNWQERMTAYNEKVGETFGFILSLPIFFIIASIIGAIIGYVLKFLITQK